MFWILVSLLLLIVGGAVICDGVVIVNARGKLYDDVESITYRKVGLILNFAGKMRYSNSEPGGASGGRNERAPRHHCQGARFAK